MSRTQEFDNGVFLLGQGRLTRAEMELTAALKAHPLNARRRVFVAWTQYQRTQRWSGWTSWLPWVRSRLQERREEARDEIARAVSNFPTVEEGWLFLAMIEADGGNLEAALQTLDRALRFVGQSSEIRNLRTRLQVALEDGPPRMVSRFSGARRWSETPVEPKKRSADMLDDEAETQLAIAPPRRKRNRLPASRRTRRPRRRAILRKSSSAS